MTFDVYEELNQKFSHYPEFTYNKGKILLEPSQPIDCLFFLKKGQIRIYVLSPTGEDITIHIYHSPAIIPMMLILAKASEWFFFETYTKSKIVKIPIEKELDYLMNNQAFLHDLSTRFASAINGLSKRVYLFASLKQKDQLYALLKYLQTHQELDSNQGLALTHSEIASWIGCARETVTRLLKQLEDEGLITYKAHKIKVLK